MENTLPKMAQTLELIPDMLSWGNVTVNQELLLDRFPIVGKLYRHLGMNVIDERQHSVAAKTLLYSCNAPPLHPYLWQQGQTKVLGVAIKPSTQRRKIVYCSRSDTSRTENPGRRVLNELALIEMVRHHLPTYYVDLFDHRQYQTIQDLIDYFADARALIGPHGGCLTNVVFIPCNAAVVELFPLVHGIDPPLGHPGMMFYMQSTFLRHEYWMLPIVVPDKSGDMHVPLDEFRDILDGIFLSNHTTG
jgi:hypothetical protein